MLSKLLAMLAFLSLPLTLGFIASSGCIDNGDGTLTYVDPSAGWSVTFENDPYGIDEYEVNEPGWGYYRQFGNGTHMFLDDGEGGGHSGGSPDSDTYHADDRLLTGVVGCYQ